MRTGQATPAATHLIKVACETAIGKRPKMDVFGTDYPTPDGTCIRDYIHVSDLAQAHSAALAYLRSGGASATFNCGYGHGASVFEVIDAVRRVSGRDFPVEISGRRPGDPRRRWSRMSIAFAPRLPWRPQFQNLDTIVAHALAWEKQLAARRKERGGLMKAQPALSADFRRQFWLEKFFAGRQGNASLLPDVPYSQPDRGRMNDTQLAIGRRRALPRPGPDPAFAHRTGPGALAQIR